MEERGGEEEQRGGPSCLTQKAHFLYYTDIGDDSFDDADDF
jgi:hypothetical protein